MPNTNLVDSITAIAVDDRWLVWAEKATADGYRIGRCRLTDTQCGGAGQPMSPTSNADVTSASPGLVVSMVIDKGILYFLSDTTLFRIGLPR